MIRRALVLLAALSACGATPHPAAAPVTTSTASDATFLEETRALLDQLVRVDTSHGHETDALRPIAARLQAAGYTPEILEGEPGRGNLVARYKGNGNKRPLLLIAHVDVVPVEAQPWTVPPFEVTEKDGYLWGRGVNDDKGMAAAIVAVALELARTKPILSRDVIFALTSGEETGGHEGAGWLVKEHRDRIDAEIALNEGGGLILSDDGARVEEVPFSASEKIFQSFKLTVHGKGGHSSVPPTDSDPVLTLARALVKVGEYRFPAKVLPGTREQLAADARLRKPPISVIEAHVAAVGKVSEEDDRELSPESTVNAVLRTTCVTTMLDAAKQDNVLPTTAQAVVNCRILPDETPEATADTLRRVIADPLVAIERYGDFSFGPPSPPTGLVPSALHAVARRKWPAALVVPVMSTGGTDSRYLRAVGITAYGIGVLAVTRAERALGHVGHGPDERRPAKFFADGARLIRDLTYDLAR